MLVLAVVDGKEVFMDALDPQTPPGYPSVPALNGRGLRLDFDAGEPTWMDIKPPKDGADIVLFDATLDGEGTLTGKVIGAHKGYNAIPERSHFAETPDGSHWKKRLAKRFPDAEVLDAKHSDLSDYEKTFFDTLDIRIPGAAQVAGDMMYLNPVIYSQFDESIFKMKERLYPVDIPYPFLEQVVLKLALPDGYAVESLPQMANLTLPINGGSFFFATEQKADGRLQVSFKMNIAKQRFEPSEYAALKEIFDIMVRKQQEPIVIRKT
jgi:hypothetical protein